MMTKIKEIGKTIDNTRGEIPVYECSQGHRQTFYNSGRCYECDKIDEGAYIEEEKRK